MHDQKKHLMHDRLFDISVAARPGARSEPKQVAELPLDTPSKAGRRVGARASPGLFVASSRFRQRHPPRMIAGSGVGFCHRKIAASPEKP